MKRFIISAALLVGISFFGIENIHAQKVEKQETTETTEITDRPGFVDANNDGICDHYDGKRPGKGLGPGAGKGAGRADGKGLGQGQGRRDGSGRISGKGRRFNNNSNGQRLQDGTGTDCPNPAPKTPKATK